MEGISGVPCQFLSTYLAVLVGFVMEGIWGSREVSTMTWLWRVWKDL